MDLNEFFSKVQFPPNTYGRIAPRSGLALKYQIDVGAGISGGFTPLTSLGAGQKNFIADKIFFDYPALHLERFQVFFFFIIVI